MSDIVPEAGGSRRVLGVGAHPDDLEILCGGTLARCAARGDTVIMCIATNGDMGHMDIKPPELAQIRRSEAEASARTIGAELIWLGFPDEFIYHDHETRMRFIEMMRQARPDIVITHNPQDYHEDHRIVSDLVFVSSFLCSVPNVKTHSEVHPAIPPLFYMDSVSGVGFLPSEYVDTTETFEVKKRALSCHKSQLQWLRDYNDMDILDTIEVISRFRGIGCGTRYAEGFTRAEAWPRVTSTRLLP